VTVSDAPLGLGKTEEVVAGPSSTVSSSQAGGVTTITSLHPHTKSHTEAASYSAGDTAPQPDVGEMLPSDDAMVYGGEEARRALGGWGLLCLLVVVCVWGGGGRTRAAHLAGDFALHACGSPTCLHAYGIAEGCYTVAGSSC
jgi:hypothetical protein